MRLMEIIHGNHIIHDLKALDKWEAIEELIDHLVMEHEIRIIDREAVLDAVLERERSMSTGMEDNLAIPHGATDFVEDTIGIIGISKKGIPFDSLDGKDTHIICMLVYPKDTFRQHVRTLAGIARLLQDPQFRNDLINSSSAEEIIRIIEEKESKEFFK